MCIASHRRGKGRRLRPGVSLGQSQSASQPAFARALVRVCLRAYVCHAHSSTAIYGCNYSGIFDLEVITQFSLVGAVHLTLGGFVPMADRQSTTQRHYLGSAF